MESWQLMMEAGNYFPEHIKPWIYWMQFVLILGPIIFIKYVPARYLLLSQVFNAATAYLVFVAEGNQVTKLFGLGHFFWLIPLWMLARDLRSDKWIVYRTYAGIAVVTIAISLVFDIRDIGQWVLGDRASVLEGYPGEGS